MNLSGRNQLDLRHCTPMERAEEYRCASEYARTRAPLLARRLVTANLRLVVVIAKGYRRPHLDLRDLVQEGNLGLIHAVEMFDPERGVKLCSYAAWWIRAYILKYTIDTWRLVRAGTTQAQRRLFFRLGAEQNKLERDGTPAETSQLAAALNVRESDVVLMLERFAGGDTSLDAPRSRQPHDTRTVGDSLSVAPELQPDARVEASEFTQTLRGKLKVFADALEGRERVIFERRLLTDEPDTLASLSDDFGVTRERARQLEKRLIGRLRQYLRQELGEDVAGHEACA